MCRNIHGGAWTVCPTISGLHRWCNRVATRQARAFFSNFFWRVTRGWSPSLSGSPRFSWHLTILCLTCLLFLDHAMHTYPYRAYRTLFCPFLRKGFGSASLNADPDQAFHFSADLDPDPVLHFDADPHPESDSHQRDSNPIWARTALHSSIFEPRKLQNFDFKCGYWSSFSL